MVGFFNQMKFAFPSERNCAFSGVVLCQWEKKGFMQIDEETYTRIGQMINSDDSPVGIDAKKTHIFIIHKLEQIEKRLEALENMDSEDEGDVQKS